MLADDTTLFTKDADSLKIALKILDEFKQSSGLTLNYQKREVLPIGKCNLPKLPVKVVKKSYSLGTWFFSSVKDIIEENHKHRLEQLDCIFTRWKARKLSLYGKATIIKTLAVSKLIYTISSLTTPEWFVIKAQELIFDFLWNGKLPKVKNNVITNTIEKGVGI